MSLEMMSSERLGDMLANAHGEGQWGALRDAALWLTNLGHGDLAKQMLAHFNVPPAPVPS